MNSRCAGCYKYPFCNKIESPTGCCNDFKSKIEKITEEEFIKALKK